MLILIAILLFLSKGLFFLVASYYLLQTTHDVGILLPDQVEGQLALDV